MCDLDVLKILGNRILKSIVKLLCLIKLFISKKVFNLFINIIISVVFWKEIFIYIYLFIVDKFKIYLRVKYWIKNE